MHPTFYTFRYRGWWIHTKLQGNTETVQVQAPDYQLFPARTVEGAKRFITGQKRLESLR